MANLLKWDQVGEREWETGISKVVLFPVDEDGTYGNGVAWNGITGITESPSGGDATKLYANNTIYGTLYSTEEYGGTIEAYMAPEEFDECDGTKALLSNSHGIMLGQQTRKAFGLAYRTEIGNDVNERYGYIIHVVYGAKASPSERSYSTVNESPEAMTLSWTFTTTPVDAAIEGKDLKPVAHLEIDVSKLLKDPATGKKLTSTALTAMEAKIAALESKLYGTAAIPDPDGGDPTPAVPAVLPTIKEILEIFETI